MPLNRRTFILAGGGAAAAYAAPSDRITLGVIGAGGRGTLVMTTFQENPPVRVGAVCDVYEPNLERALSIAAKTPGNHPKPYRNYKQLLEDKSVDAVLIATPEHWHHRMLLDALAAGKDVYVEKPLCKTPEQGVELLEAEKRTKNIVQVGTQRRSYDVYLEGRKIVASDTLGTVQMVRSWWLNNNLKRVREAKLEGPLDWEQWQGPTRKRPFDPYVFRNWRDFTEYSGGMMAEQGIHIYDAIHMLMGSGGPVAVTAAAGKPHREHSEHPESVVVTAEYAEDYLGIFSINYAAMPYKNRNDQLNQLDGDKARMDISRNELRVYMRGADETPAISKASAVGFDGAVGAHVRNFLDCVRSRKTPNATITFGFQATLAVQLANLSLQHGRRVKWNAATNKVEI